MDVKTKTLQARLKRNIGLDYISTFITNLNMQGSFRGGSGSVGEEEEHDPEQDLYCGFLYDYVIFQKLWTVCAELYCSGAGQ